MSNWIEKDKLTSSLIAFIKNKMEDWELFDDTKWIDNGSEIRLAIEQYEINVESLAPQVPTKDAPVIDAEKLAEKISSVGFMKYERSPDDKLTATEVVTLVRGEKREIVQLISDSIEEAENE